MRDYYENDTVTVVRFAEGHYEYSKETGKVEKIGETNYVVRKGPNNTVIFDNGSVCKTINIGASNDYVYDIKKTKINALGGVNGLMRLMQDEEGLRLVIVHKVFAYMTGKTEFSKAG